jgi:hypothetical protein
MLVITEVCTAYGSLGHAVIELNERETEIFLQWQEEVEERRVQKVKHNLLVNRFKNRLEQFHETRA